jgi:hypothetical protein
MILKEIEGRTIQFETREWGAYGGRSGDGIPSRQRFDRRLAARSELRLNESVRQQNWAFAASQLSFTAFYKFVGVDEAHRRVALEIRVPLGPGVGKQIPRPTPPESLPPAKVLQPTALNSLAGKWQGHYRDDQGFEIPMEMTIREDGSFEAAIDDPVTSRFRGTVAVRDGQLIYSSRNDTGVFTLYEGEGKRILQGNVSGKREGLPDQPGVATSTVNFLFRVESQTTTPPVAAAATPPTPQTVAPTPTPSPTAPPAVTRSVASGTLTGSYAGLHRLISPEVAASIRAVLVQNGDSVSGSYSLGSGDAGTFKGTVSGSSLSGEMVSAKDSVPCPFLAIVSLDGLQLDGTFACKNGVAGSFKLKRD